MNTDPQTTDTSAATSDTAHPTANSVRPAPRLHYLHSYSFVFESPKSGMNVLLASVCLIIPVVGPIVIAGYQYAVIEALHRRPHETYPDFDFNKFVDYLGLGVWKFLVSMLSQFILFPAFMVAYYGAVIAIVVVGSLFSQNDPDAAGRAMGIAAAFIIPLAILFLLVVTIGVRSITNPLVLKASLSGDPKGLFDIAFLFDFFKRTWKEMILELLWVYVTFPVVLFLGLLLFCIGYIPAIFLSMMADAHTNWQLYEIYLARGGAPIPLKSDQPLPAVLMPAVEMNVPPQRIGPVDLDAE